MCVTHVRERQISKLQLAEFLGMTPELGMGLSSATPPALSQLSEVKVLHLELLVHTAKDHSWVLSSSVWSGSERQLIVLFTLDTMTKNCTGFPLGVALDRLAGKETLSFLDIAALLIYPHRRSKDDHWFSSYFPHSSETEFASRLSPFLLCLGCLLVWHYMRKTSWVEATRE